MLPQSAEPQLKQCPRCLPGSAKEGLRPLEAEYMENSRSSISWFCRFSLINCYDTFWLCKVASISPVAATIASGPRTTKSPNCPCRFPCSAILSPLILLTSLPLHLDTGAGHIHDNCFSDLDMWDVLEIFSSSTLLTFLYRKVEE